MIDFQHYFAENPQNSAFQKTATYGTSDARDGIVTAKDGILVAHIPHSTSAKVLSTHTPLVRSIPDQSSFER